MRTKKARYKMQNKSKGRPDGLPLILNSFFLLLNFTYYLRLRRPVCGAHCAPLQGVGGAAFVR